MGTYLVKNKKAKFVWQALIILLIIFLTVKFALAADDDNFSISYQGTVLDSNNDSVGAATTVRIIINDSAGTEYVNDIDTVDFFDTVSGFDRVFTITNQNFTYNDIYNLCVIVSGETVNSECFKFKAGTGLITGDSVKDGTIQQSDLNVSDVFTNVNMTNVNITNVLFQVATGDIVSSTNITYNLGNETNWWKTIWVQTAYLYDVYIYNFLRLGNGSHTEQTLIEVDTHQDNNNLNITYDPQIYGLGSFDGLIIDTPDDENGTLALESGQAAYILGVTKNASQSSELNLMFNDQPNDIDSAAQAVFQKRATSHDVAIGYRYGLTDMISAIVFDVNPSGNEIYKVVFNDGGDGINISIEDDSSGNLFYADVESSRVGIGTNLPVTKLDVRGNTNVSGWANATNFSQGGSNTLSNNIDGNAATATALAANPTDCDVYQFATDIEASGNLNCEAVQDNHIPNDITIDLAATATALAANGANCNAGEYPLGVDASGAVEGCTTDGTINNSDYVNFTNVNIMNRIIMSTPRIGDDTIGASVGGVNIGFGSTNAGSGGVAIGVAAIANGEGVTIGSGGSNAELNAIAIGYNAHADSDWSISLGMNSNSTQNYGVAIGHGAISNATNCVALGKDTVCNEPDTVKIGTSSVVLHKDGQINATSWVNASDYCFGDGTCIDDWDDINHTPTVDTTMNNTDYFNASKITVGTALPGNAGDLNISGVAQIGGNILYLNSNTYLSSVGGSGLTAVVDGLSAFSFTNALQDSVRIGGSNDDVDFGVFNTQGDYTFYIDSDNNASTFGAFEYADRSQTYAVKVIGNTLMEGNLNVTGLINTSQLQVDYISINGTTFTGVDANTIVNGSVFCINMTGPTGANLPHFCVQAGGGTQASYIMRSLMIVNENESFFNGTDRTDCLAYMDSIGETLKIDCNTTTTGADLLVSDDAQIVGDVYVKDSDGDWHFLTRVMQIWDELFDDTVNTAVNVTIDETEVNVTEANGDNLVINIDETEVILTVSSQKVSLENGSNVSPNFNHVYYDGLPTPTLQVSTTAVDDVADVAQAMVGDGYIYGSVGGSAQPSEFVRGVYHRLYDEGAIYISGFGFNVTAEEVNISTGAMKIMITKGTTTMNHSTSNISICINSSGEYLQFTDLDDWDTYSDGGAIGNNKYFNIIFGIAWTEDGKGRMYGIAQNEPASGEYTTLIDAEVDEDNTITFFPPDDFIKKIYIPVLRVVVQRSGGDNQVQTLSSSVNYIDLRGTITTTGGSAAEPTITDHADLDNLAWSVAAHTIDTDLDMNNNDILEGGNINASGWVNATNIVSGTGDFSSQVDADTFSATASSGALYENSDTALISREGNIITILNNSFWKSLVLNTNNTASLTIGSDNSVVVTTGRLGVPNGNFSVGSSDLFVDNTNGYVGIGTASPGVKLQVIGNVNISDSLNISQNMSLHSYTDCPRLSTDTNGFLQCNASTIAAGGGTSVWTAGSGTIYNSTSGLKVGIGTASPSEGLTVRGNVSLNNTLYVNESGNVGIGIATPNAKLQVVGATAIQFNNAATDGFKFVQQTTNSWGLTALNNPSNFSILQANVGIKISTPNASLHVFTADAGAVAPSSSADEIIAENSGTGGISVLVPDNAYGLLHFGTPNDNDAGVIGYGGPSVADADYQDSLYFKSNGAVNMLIDNGGNVGIGITNPGGSSSATLDVVGPIITSDGTDAGSIYFRHDRSADARIREENHALYMESANGIEFDFDENGNDAGFFRVMDDDTNVFQISEGGNVGIGTAGPTAKLDVNGTGSFTDALHVGNQTGEYITSYGGYIGNATANIGGTGDAAYFPEGIYSAKHNWLYGGITMNNGNLVDAGDIDFNDEIKPDGATCNNNEILQKIGTDDWDCVAFLNVSGDVNSSGSICIDAGCINTMESRIFSVQSGKLNHFDNKHAATISGANERWSVDFDQDTNESIDYQFMWPTNYVSGTPIAKIIWMSNTTTNEVVWNVSIMANTPDASEDYEADSFDDGNSATTTVPGTVNQTVSSTITLTNRDSVAAGDMTTMRVRRDADDAADDAAGDAKMVGLILYW